MNLYLISQTVNSSYDTYDSAVVAAENEHDAARMNPNPTYEWRDDGGWHYLYSDGTARAEGSDRAWADPSQVDVRLIGIAADDVTGVICASFNAG